MTTLRMLLFAAALYAPLASADDTTPVRCERLTIAKTRSWVAPILRDFCKKERQYGAAIRVMDGIWIAMGWPGA